ncbi:F0F1 ATP synthase subunit delta [Spiroplasma tabanidicola]|uniref:ATP synthase subunit delta n=1 Tax=Spiroplasma tabanidicola TaxID=324079 RepID=A0A6I6CHI3_9MOLU|nr:F0F1 ATP synthase subunit delta [Spiroplasma tabanidicola]QGS51503.1 F0F1 ATP synthase subunit delta [Spiroplasma tabanidicola]
MFIKESLIRNWSNAICNIAIETKKVEEFLNTAKDLNQIFKSNYELMEFLSNKSIDINTRLKVIDNIFAKQIDKNLTNALKLIVIRDIVPGLRHIIKQVIKDLLDATNTIQGVVYSISPLDPSIIKKIEAKLSTKTDKKVILDNVIDKELIAGIKVELAGKKYDSSIQGKSLDMRRKVMKNRK